MPNSYGGQRRPSLARPAGPIHVPSLDCTQQQALLTDLRDWVTQLIDRYALDPRTIPPCWARHNAMVEALAALRDCERGCYDIDATPAAGIEWLHALHDVTEFLRERTSLTGCATTGHRPDLVG